MFTILAEPNGAGEEYAMAMHRVQDVLFVWRIGEGGEKTCRFPLCLLLTVIDVVFVTVCGTYE